MAGIVKDARTANLNLPLPDVQNSQASDVVRIAASLTGLDTAHGEISRRVDSAAQDAASAGVAAGTATQKALEALELAGTANSRAEQALASPGALVLSPPELTFPPMAAAGFPASLSIAAGPIRLCDLSHFMVSVDDAEPMTVPAVDNAAVCQVEFTGEVGRSVTVRVVAVDALGNTSTEAQATARISQSHIRRPSLASPAAGASVVWNDAGISLTSSAFADELGIDTHKSTDWKITSDAGGNSVIAQAMNSQDRTEHTVAVGDLGAVTNGATLYLWVRHHGNLLGASQ